MAKFRLMNIAPRHEPIVEPEPAPVSAPVKPVALVRRGLAGLDAAQTQALGAMLAGVIKGAIAEATAELRARIDGAQREVREMAFRTAAAEMRSELAQREVTEIRRTLEPTIRALAIATPETRERIAKEFGEKHAGMLDRTGS